MIEEEAKKSSIAALKKFFFSFSVKRWMEG
jgi:hypothetical protein